MMFLLVLLVSAAGIAGMAWRLRFQRRTLDGAIRMRDRALADEQAAIRTMRLAAIELRAPAMTLLGYADHLTQTHPAAKGGELAIQAAAIAGGAKQSDEGEFDHLVAIDVVAFVRAKNPVDMIGESGRGVEDVGMAAELVFGDGHFKEVAGIVHLVAEAEVVPAFVLVLDDVVGDEEAVGLLGGEDAPDDCCGALAQIGVVKVLQRDEHALQGLVQV